MNFASRSAGPRTEDRLHKSNVCLLLKVLRQGEHMGASIFFASLLASFARADHVDLKNGLLPIAIRGIQNLHQALPGTTGRD